MCSKLQDQNKDNTLFKISRFQVLCLIENQCFLFPWLFKKNHVFRPMPNIRKTIDISEKHSASEHQSTHMFRTGVQKSSLHY